MSNQTRFDNVQVSLDSFPVTPNDAAELPQFARSIRCAVGGNLSVTTGANERRDMLFTDGETRFVAVRKVWADGTTCDGIEGMP